MGTNHKKDLIADAKKINPTGTYPTVLICMPVPPPVKADAVPTPGQPYKSIGAGTLGR